MDGDQVPIGSSQVLHRSRRLGIGAGILAAGLVLAIASGAQAKDEFEDGFKIELGRIAAHEAVRAGKHILGGVLLGGHGYPDGYHGASYPAGYGYGDGGGDGHGHGHQHGHHWRHHRGHHRHHDGCGHHSSTHVYYVPAPYPYYYESHQSYGYGYPPRGHRGGWQQVEWEDDD